MQQITIYTDGGARGNPGPAGVGVVIQNGRGEVVKKLSQYIGETTNNFAEYEALVRALQTARELFGEELARVRIVVKMDSELIVRQLQGRYKVKDEVLKKQFTRVGQLVGTLPHITFEHIAREHNACADALVNEAIDAVQKPPK